MHFALGNNKQAEFKQKEPAWVVSLVIKLWGQVRGQDVSQISDVVAI